MGLANNATNAIPIELQMLELSSRWIRTSSWDKITSMDIVMVCFRRKYSKSGIVYLFSLKDFNNIFCRGLGPMTAEAAIQSAFSGFAPVKVR